MAAELRVDTIKSRAGINTLNFAGDGLYFHKSVGIGTTITSDPIQVGNPGKIAAGVGTFRDVYSNIVRIGDGDQIIAGVGSDLKIYHSGSHSYIQDEGTGNLYIDANQLYLRQASDDTVLFQTTSAGVVQIKYNGNTRIETTNDGADISGTGSVKIPVGTTAQRNGSPADGDIRYNSTINSFEGYGNSAWGGLGGGTEIDVSVSSTSATNLTTFAHASYRSASLRVQIVQGSAYQVGRYLLIHDGTTVTVVEEAAIATGSMLGTISAVINSSNVEVKVTMGSSSSATVTTIIDKITV